MEILVSLQEEFSSLMTDRIRVELWDAVALLILPDNKMQVSFNDDLILDYWSYPEYIFQQ